MRLREEALWRRDSSALVQLLKLNSLVLGPSCPMNDLCLIIHEMHIKVDTPAYADEDYGDHAKHI